MNTIETGLTRYLETLCALRADNLETLDAVMASDVHFADPFNDVRDIGAVKRIFRDMFENVSDVTFAVENRMLDGSVALIAWRLDGVLRGGKWAVSGASRVTLNDQGVVTEHVDYWDAARGLYETFPIIGPLLRVLRRRLQAG